MVYTVRGFLQIDNHCSFPFEEDEGSIHRKVHVESHHCGACLQQLMRVAQRCALRLQDDRGCYAIRHNP